MCGILDSDAHEAAKGPPTSGHRACSALSLVQGRHQVLGMGRRAGRKGAREGGIRQVPPHTPASVWPAVLIEKAPEEGQVGRGRGLHPSPAA